MLQIRNQFGQLDISVIDPVAVAGLSEPAQVLLKTLIDAVENRQRAQDRHNKAMAALHEATHDQALALAEHAKANPPQTFQQAHAASVTAFQKSN